MDAPVPVSHYRTIWISDIHLGTRGCSADALLDFLKFTESEYLYLVERAQQAPGVEGGRIGRGAVARFRRGPAKFGLAKGGP